MIEQSDYHTHAGFDEIENAAAKLEREWAKLRPKGRVRSRLSFLIFQRTVKSALQAIDNKRHRGANFRLISCPFVKSGIPAGDWF